MNSWAWIGWLCSALLVISSTRNPLYLLLVLLQLQIIFSLSQRRKEGESLAVISPLRFSLFVICMAAVFNALTSHIGQTVWFTIPGRLPLISGPVTLEALIFGFTNGLVLANMLTAFTILNVVLPISALIRLVPRAFYPLSIIVSIAVTFLPSTRRQIDQVIEAQKIRGQRLAGLRDWLPLVMPLLVGGLERSLQLAETMTARGFASQTAPFDPHLRAQVFGGLLLMLAGWVAGFTAAPPAAGWILILAGAGLIGAGFWQIGRRMPRSVFRPERWKWSDLVVIAASIGLILTLLFGLPAPLKETLLYQPYPAAEIPPFSDEVGLLLQVLLLPAFFTGRQPPRGQPQ